METFSEFRLAHPPPFSFARYYTFAFSSIFSFFFSSTPFPPPRDSTFESILHSLAFLLLSRTLVSLAWRSINRLADLNYLQGSRSPCRSPVPSLATLAIEPHSSTRAQCKSPNRLSHFHRHHHHRSDFSEERPLRCAGVQDPFPKVLGAPNSHHFPTPIPHPTQTSNTHTSLCFQYTTTTTTTATTPPLP